MSLLDTVDPDARLDVADNHTFGIVRDLYGAEVRKLPVGDYQLYSHTKVESLLAENTKQVLIEAELYLINLSSRYIPAALELRRMASEPIGNDLEGEKR